MRFLGVIVVTGIPGVGKTTVMKKAAKGIDINFVTFGTLMIEIAQEMKLVKDRDEMRKLSLEQQKKLQIKTAERIAKMKNVIVDTHCTVKTPKGYMPGLPEWVVKKIKPTAIVLVEADPEEIYNRRENDKSRNRDPDTLRKSQACPEGSWHRRWRRPRCRPTGPVGRDRPQRPLHPKTGN